MVRRYVRFLVFAGYVPLSVSAQAAKRPSSSASQNAVMRQAAELRAQHKVLEATRLLEGYLAVHTEDTNALTLLAQIKVDAGDTNAAQELLVRALRAHPDSPPANLLAGRMLLTAQEFPQAMDRFETVLASLPNDPEARRLELEAATKLAVQAQTAGNGEAALAVFEHARTKMPDSPELLLRSGMLAFDLHKLAEAEETLAAARALEPRGLDIAYGLARVEIEEQHMPAAEADLRFYLAARPNDASAHFGLGHIYAMEQRDAAARTEFERSIQLQPVQTESYYQIGQLALNARKDEEAQALFLKVISRDPNHGGALAGLGQIAFRAKANTQAEEYLRRAVKAAPEYAPAHYYLGLLLARLGQKVEADEELRLASKLGHDAGGALQTAPPGTQP